MSWSCRTTKWAFPTKKINEYLSLTVLYGIIYEDFFRQQHPVQFLWTPLRWFTPSGLLKSGWKNPQTQRFTAGKIVYKRRFYGIFHCEWRLIAKIFIYRWWIFQHAMFNSWRVNMLQSRAMTLTARQAFCFAGFSLQIQVTKYPGLELPLYLFVVGNGYWEAPQVALTSSDQ